MVEYRAELEKVNGLTALVDDFHPKLSDNQRLLMMEFVLHGLSEFSQLSKNYLDGGFGFSDMFDSLFSNELTDDEDEDFN